MAKSMLGKARTAAQKAATKKWQRVGAEARRRGKIVGGSFKKLKRLQSAQQEFYKKGGYSGDKKAVSLARKIDVVRKTIYFHSPTIREKGVTVKGRRIRFKYERP